MNDYYNSKNKDEIKLNNDDLTEQANALSMDIAAKIAGLSNELDSMLFDIEKVKDEHTVKREAFFDTSYSQSEEYIEEEQENKQVVEKNIQKTNDVASTNVDDAIQISDEPIIIDNRFKNEEVNTTTNKEPVVNVSSSYTVLDNVETKNEKVNENIESANKEIVEEKVEDVNNEPIKEEIETVQINDTVKQDTPLQVNNAFGESSINADQEKTIVMSAIKEAPKKEETKIFTNAKEKKFDFSKLTLNPNGGSNNGGHNKNKKKKNNSEKRPQGKKSTFVLAVIVCTIVFFGICCFSGGCYFIYKLCQNKPDFNAADLESSDSTIIYDSEGNQVIELGLYLRQNIEYDDIPSCVIDAFVSIEDSRFFEHFGFDIPRFSKAILSNLRTLSFGQGGSTMTMQLIKSSYFQVDDGEDSTMAARAGMSGIQRKIQEIVLAIEAEQKLSKQEIFTLYLNKLNFGDNVRGIQKAAEYYFGKDAKELSLNEAAFLAGIVNAPNGNNPYNAAYGNTDYLVNANERKNEVLNLMAYHGYITDEEAKINKRIRIENLLVGKGAKFAETNQYYQSFIDAVINEAQEVTGKNPYTTAMNIYTSMDPYMQEYVYNMQNNPEKFKDKYIFRSDLQQNALVVLNNQTGALVALGGGRNQADEARQFNRAVDSYINPGSSIKPVLEYCLAFDKLGYATSHTICDKPVFLYETDILVSNAYGQGYTGDMTITEALARSLNTPAIQLLDQVIEKIDEEGVIEYCKSIGLDHCSKRTFDIQWAIGGRDCLVTPVQLAGAHAMLIHGGKYIKPHTISRIEYRGKYNDKEDYVADTEGTQVVSPAAAYMTAYCENYNVNSGWIGQLNLLKRDYPTFAKTGTTNFSEAAYINYNIPETAAKDQWLCCQTSNYTVVVWNGFDNLEDDAYFTVVDENYNLKCKMGSLILDALMERFNYDAHELEQPDDCIEISHKLGCFPYVAGDTTGLISKNSEYAELVDEGSIVKEQFGGKLYHMGSVETAEGLYIHWDEFNSYLDEGTMDLSATSVSGQTTAIATGRSYYPRYTFLNPDMFYATVTAASGEETAVESALPTTLAQVAGIGPYKVCGWTSAGHGPVCGMSRYDDDDE